MKDKKILDDLEFVEGLINVASLSPIQKLQLVLKSHIENSELLTLAFSVLEKIMLSYVKNTSDTPFGQLKSLVNSISTCFESLEKFAEAKVHNEFNAKRLRTLKRMIADDRVILDTYVKSIQDALSEGDNIFKSCLSFSKFTEDIEK